MRYNERERIKKYRPVLTAAQIAHIVILCKQGETITSEDINVLKSLAPFEAKIQADAITPSYELALPKPSLEESLGMENPVEQLDKLIPHMTCDTSHLTKEEQWELAYKKWLLKPLSCTAHDLELANEHKYLHDLMTPEEVTAYETGSMITSSDTRGES